MSKICPRHHSEMVAKEIGGVMNYFCDGCGAETMAKIFPVSSKAEHRNARVQTRYDELMRAGKHGHYETMFQVVREEIERVALSQEKE